MRCLLALSLLLLAVACGPGETQPGETAPPSREADALVAVLAQLNDPESARFGRIWTNGGGIVYGSVNAKNQFGGYAGARPFWFDPATGEAYLVPGQPSAAAARIFKEQGCPSGLERMLPAV